MNDLTKPLWSTCIEKGILPHRDREELERSALAAISATDYYDLADNLEITTDIELLQIIEGAGQPE